MAAQRHILAVSGSRSDYSLLVWPLRLLRAEPSFRLEVAVTGMHLLPAFGNTVDQFAADGFEIAARVPTQGPEDSPEETARAIGRGIIGFTETLSRLKPDLLLVLGDRFETFAAAQAAFVLRIPIAHLCGGDVSNGALDDGFRHAIAKMASLHFPTNQDAAQRLRQLGEMPERIFNVGSTGIDFIKRAELLPRAELEANLGHVLPERFLLVTFHPATLDPVPSLDQVGELLAALGGLPADIGLVFTFANADAEGARINELLVAFASSRPLAHCHPSLGPTRFQSLLRLTAAMVGNSSSGLYEAPSWDVPAVNIGRRQDGRLRASSVIDCPPQRDAIAAAIKRALGLSPKGTISPYGDGKASERIVDVLKNLPDWQSLVYKSFLDLPATGEK
ncbi:UDP-N-acetylglucosamine 2-epimerase [Dongia rigui]|uniref:UDP-N-acetylglucosamine 2-epimerase n=1 Tax=Dongia rigui TaxID=940149 RepID=A0ABU5E2D2_9PROT|nr:UDP-N-acetylglucosamine 2-epimerase [Dongia rigui]MDY0873658.1 UDP-N-acetylglucosamine 2-epimerase [Dongia rigui]